MPCLSIFGPPLPAFSHGTPPAARCGRVGPTVKTGGCRALCLPISGTPLPVSSHGTGPAARWVWWARQPKRGAPGALPSYFRHSASGLLPQHASSGTLGRVGPTAKMGGCRAPCLPISGTPLPASSHVTGPAARWIGWARQPKRGDAGCPAFLFQALRFRALPTARLQRHAGVGWAKRGSSHGEPLFQYSLGFMRPVLSPLFHNRPVRTFLYNPCFPSFGPPAGLRCKRLQTFDLVSDLRRKYSSPSDTLSHPAV